MPFRAGRSPTGHLILNGEDLVKTTGHAHGVGIVQLVVRTEGKAKKLLARKGKVKARVAFTPRGGMAVSAMKTIELRGHRAIARWPTSRALRDWGVESCDGQDQR